MTKYEVAVPIPPFNKCSKFHFNNLAKEVFMYSSSPTPSPVSSPHRRSYKFHTPQPRSIHIPWIQIKVTSFEQKLSKKGRVLPFYDRDLTPRFVTSSSQCPTYVLVDQYGPLHADPKQPWPMDRLWQLSFNRQYYYPLDVLTAQAQQRQPLPAAMRALQLDCLYPGEWIDSASPVDLRYMSLTLHSLYRFQCPKWSHDVYNAPIVWIDFLKQELSLPLHTLMNRGTATLRFTDTPHMRHLLRNFAPVLRDSMSAVFQMVKTNGVDYPHQPPMLMESLIYLIHHLDERSQFNDHEESVQFINQERLDLRVWNMVLPQDMPVVETVVAKIGSNVLYSLASLCEHTLQDPYGEHVPTEAYRVFCTRIAYDVDWETSFWRHWKQRFEAPDGTVYVWPQVRVQAVCACTFENPALGLVCQCTVMDYTLMHLPVMDQRCGDEWHITCMECLTRHGVWERGFRELKGATADTARSTGAAAPHPSDP